jgi:hypothetical protein
MKSWRLISNNRTNNPPSAIVGHLHAKNILSLPDGDVVIKNYRSNTRIGPIGGQYIGTPNEALYYLPANRYFKVIHYPVGMTINGGANIQGASPNPAPAFQDLDKDIFPIGGLDPDSDASNNPYTATYSVPTGAFPSDDSYIQAICYLETNLAYKPGDPILISYEPPDFTPDYIINFQWPQFRSGRILYYDKINGNTIFILPVNEALTGSQPQRTFNYVTGLYASPSTVVYSITLGIPEDGISSRTLLASNNTWTGDYNIYQNFVGIGSGIVSDISGVALDVSGNVNISNGTLNMNTQKISSLANGTLNGDAINLAQLTNTVSNYLPLSGASPMTGNLNMNTQKITSLANGTNPTDAVNVSQLNGGLGSYLLLSGGTMTGPINMGNQKITGLLNGTSTTDVVNKSQLDTLDAQNVKLTGNQTIAGEKTFTSKALINVNTGQSATPHLLLKNGSLIWYGLYTNLATGNFNPAVSAGDCAIITTQNDPVSNPATGVLFIGPHNNVASGFKIAPTQNTSFQPLSMNTTNKIINLANGSSANDAINKSQLDSAIVDVSNNYLKLSGGILTGILSMALNKITNVANGSSANDAINKSQLDSAIVDVSNNYLKLSGGTLTGTLNISSGNITAGQSSIYGRSFQASGSTSISSQGAHFQWNRNPGGGKTHILNQKGTGVGGIAFGDVDTANVATETMFLTTTGNLNIGSNTSSSERLRVEGNIDIVDNNSLKFSTGNRMNVGQNITNIYNNTIAINTSSAQTITTAGVDRCYVAPIRNQSASNVLFYDSSTKEVSYAPPGSNNKTYTDILIGNYTNQVINIPSSCVKFDIRVIGTGGLAGPLNAQVPDGTHVDYWLRMGGTGGGGSIAYKEGILIPKQDTYYTNTITLSTSNVSGTGYTEVLLNGTSLAKVYNGNAGTITSGGAGTSVIPVTDISWGNWVFWNGEPGQGPTESYTSPNAGQVGGGNIKGGIIGYPYINTSQPGFNQYGQGQQHSALSGPAYIFSVYTASQINYGGVIITWYIQN